MNIKFLFRKEPPYNYELALVKAIQENLKKRIHALKVEKQLLSRSSDESTT